MDPLVNPTIADFGIIPYGAQSSTQSSIGYARQ